MFEWRVRYESDKAWLPGLDWVGVTIVWGLLPR